MRTNPLILSLKYALRKKVIKIMPHSIYSMRFIGEAGGEYFLHSIFFKIKAQIMIPVAISERELENVDPNKRIHKVSSIILSRILIGIF
jgi:hypothetical protein